MPVVICGDLFAAGPPRVYGMVNELVGVSQADLHARDRLPVVIKDPAPDRPQRLKLHRRSDLLVTTQSQVSTKPALLVEEEQLPGVVWIQGLNRKRSGFQRHGPRPE